MKKMLNEIKKNYKSIITYLILLNILFFTTHVLFAIARVDGSSMYPTYHDGQYLIVKRLFNDYNKKEVISFKYDEKQQAYLTNVYGEEYAQKYNSKKGTQHLKRILGVSGDHIVIKTEDNINKVYVNNNLVCQSQGIDIPDQDYYLKENEYFVVGDNYNNSYDSRIHGPISLEQIYGEVIFPTN